MLNTDLDLAAQLKFKNESTKLVTELQVGWVIESPPGCSDVAIPNRVSFAPLEEVRIAPGATHSGLSYKVGTFHTWQLAKQLKSHHLLLQFGVVRVKFADGSEWSYDLKTNLSFDNHQQATEFACNDTSAKVDQEIKGLQNEAKAVSTDGAACDHHTVRMRDLVLHDDDLLTRSGLLRVQQPPPPENNGGGFCTWQCITTNSPQRCTRYRGTDCATDSYLYCCLTETNNDCYNQIPGCLYCSMWCSCLGS